MKSALMLFPALVMLCLGGGGVFAQTATIPWQASDASGAGILSGSSKVIYSSFGQPVVGVSNSGSDVVNSGYLYARIVPSGAPFLLTRSSVNFGSVIAAQTAAQNLVLQNTGASTLAITATAISPLPFEILSGGGARTLPAGGSATLLLRFSPANAGTFSGTLVITSNAANGSTITVTLNGTGMASAPVASVNGTALDFGSIVVGSGPTTKRSVTISNTGNAPLTVSGQTITGTDAAEFAFSRQCNPSISANASDYFEITFDPTSTGTKYATFSFATNDPNNPLFTVSLAGLGTQTGQPHLNLSARVLNFGTQEPNKPVSREIAITNTGSSVLVISSHTVVGNGFSLRSFSADTVPPSASVVASIEFRPSAAGDFFGTFDITSNDPSSPVATVSLSGKGGAASGPRIVVSRNLMDFGSVWGDPHEEEVTIRNIGTADLLITRQTLGGTDAGSFLISQYASGTISPGDSSKARIKPATGGAGSKVASYIVQTNDPGSPMVDVLLIMNLINRVEETIRPVDLVLHQNHPNPFNPATVIEYSIREAAAVDIIITDFGGRHISTFHLGRLEPGSHRLNFDASGLPSGTYHARVRASTRFGEEHRHITMTYLK